MLRLELREYNLRDELSVLTVLAVLSVLNLPARSRPRPTGSEWCGVVLAEVCSPVAGGGGRQVGGGRGKEVLVMHHRDLDVLLAHVLNVDLTLVMEHLRLDHSEGDVAPKVNTRFSHGTESELY